MSVLDITLTSVKPNSITKSNTLSETDEGEAPAFVTREGFASFAGASAVVAAIGVPLSKLAANHGVDGAWIPYVLAMVWTALMVWNGIEKNPGAKKSEYAISAMIGLANGLMLGTVGLGADLATPDFNGS